MVHRLSPIDRNLEPPQPVRQNSRTAVRRLRLRVVVEPLGTMALHCKTPSLGRRYGRSIVPNRSEPRATAASKTKQPNSRKTPLLARRAEPLGTMALHCMTPPLGRRYGRSIVPNRSEPRATVASKTKQPNSRKTPPLARRAEPLGLTLEPIAQAHRVRGRPWGLGATFVPRAVC